jgi:hypothetical protein
LSLVHNPEGALVVNEHIDIALKKEVTRVSAWAKLRVSAKWRWATRIKALPGIPSCACARSRPKLNESGRAGLSTALKNDAAGPGCCGFTAWSAEIQAFGRPQAPLRRKTLVPQLVSGDLHIKRHATWGISGQLGLVM